MDATITFFGASRNFRRFYSMAMLTPAEGILHAVIGIRQSALASLELLRKTTALRLQAYSDRVNRYIERCGKNCLEFRLLRYQPQPGAPRTASPFKIRLLGFVRYSPASTHRHRRQD